MTNAVKQSQRRRYHDTRSAIAGVGLVIVTCCCSISATSAELSSTRTLDSFDQIAAWEPLASDDVRASIDSADGPRGRAIRLDFDLRGTAGYAIARRALPLDLPPNYEISFYLRADAPVNNLQFKLIDASGDNVWWFNRPNFEFPRQWELVTIKKRQIEFAWGPTKDRTLNHAATIEFVVSAGRGGGNGSVYVSELSLRELPTEPTSFPAPSAQASSYLPGSEPSFAVDGSLATGWKSDRATGKAQVLTVDFGRRREFGGLILHWQEHAFASRYDVEFSDDGSRWRTVRSVVDGNGGPDVLLLPEAQARFVRLALQEGPADAYGLAEMEIKDLAFGASPNALFESLAREAPRGTYPRGFSAEQSAWTLVGVDGGSESGLLSEDGALEVAKGGFSIEPFVVTNSQVVTWADVDANPFLVGDYLPIPGVTWRHPQWALRVSSFASGSRTQSRLIARYDLTNHTAQPLTLTLVLAARPFQVNPPTQFLNTVGGVSAIRDIKWDGSVLSINGERRIFPLRPPDRVGAFSFNDGPIPKIVAQRNWTGAQALHDAAGYASAALGYDLTLPPHATTTVGFVVPLSGSAKPPDLGGQPAPKWIARQQEAVVAAWREKLNRVSLRVPAQAQPLVDTMRTALAHLLVTRDGPILRPGTRSYARSWIRDGAMISESLLRLGHANIAADYLRWYAPHQFRNGKVPCCIDDRGADPVPENDSPGEFVFLVAEIYRYTHDRMLIEAMWPHVEAAIQYLERLRQSERNEVNLAPAKRAFYGLLPASISHEGYSEKPMHSYWDDFWALKGYDDAVAIATALGHAGAAARLSAQRDEFRRELSASLQASAAMHGIAYLPGSAELGDFDPTSTTIAFAPHGDTRDLPSALVQSTYERYWREFIDRRDGNKAWEEYTPYELRTVGTFVRLGWRDRAQELLAFFLAGRRPPAWNQWPEVVGRDPRKTRFVGDMPHAWVASDFIRSVLDLFAYERNADHALVLAAGIPPAWLDGAGISVGNLRTSYGMLSYSLKKVPGRMLLNVDAGSQLRRGHFVFIWPWQEPPRSTFVNGKTANWQGNELHIGELPARIVVEGFDGRIARGSGKMESRLDSVAAPGRPN
jgi:hypothetical protein